MPRHIEHTLTASPAVALLGGSELALAQFADGTRRAIWRGLAVNRWSASRTHADDILIRDLDHGRLWSASGQAYAAGRAQVVFGHGTARFAQDLEGVAAVLECAVLRDPPALVRHLTLSNAGTRPRRFELASAVELVIGPDGADAAHPAFSKMFVETEAIDGGRMLLACRRPRSGDEKPIRAAHGCRIDGGTLDAAGFETDRALLLGRCRTIADPRLFDEGVALAGSAGIVLDPVFCLRRRVTLAPGATLQATWLTLAGEERDALCSTLESVLARDGDEVLAASRTADDSAATTAYQTLAAPLLHPDFAWRGDPAALARGRGGAPALWAHAISGDRPIVLACVEGDAGAGLASELLAAQRWWLDRQLAADVVLIARPAGSGALKSLVAQDGPAKDAGAAAFVLDAGTLDTAAMDALSTAARVELDSRDGNLAAQCVRRTPKAEHVPAIVAVPKDSGPRGEPGASPVPALELDNGYGGFANDGREYVVRLDGDTATPAPWTNIVANPDFGFMATAEGGGHTWSINSQQNRITPWLNDAVTDPPTEVIYLRDADSGRVWTATAEPIRAGGTGVTRHGIGYTRFERSVDGIESSLLLFVPRHGSVKIARLALRNVSGRTRRVDVCAWFDLALGPAGRVDRANIVTSRDAASGALLAHNAWRATFGDRVVYCDLADAGFWTCDRRAFLGPAGDPAVPAALGSEGMPAGRCGIGVDPCFAIGRRVELAAGATGELVVLLGEAGSADDAIADVANWRAADLDAQLAEVTAFWNDTCGTLTIATPARGADLLVNHWLPWQVLSCRVWGRTAFYQSSGAYGFRDQLQDVMALCVSRPDIAREHLLRAAGRQFVAGDVQHWWLPPTGAGIRTRVVDDRLWLPCVVAHYIGVTGDAAVLDAEVPFLAGEPLRPDQTDNFFTPQPAQESGSLFEHCARAIDASLAVGPHGLPLFGTGDWNDGMNRVGKDGKGESVWMAWFLVTVIREFAVYADARDAARAQRWRTHAGRVVAAADAVAWNGDWWQRGWYDNGDTLGAKGDAACEIDSIAQSWSVFAGMPPQRTAAAMASVDRLLVDRDARLIALFEPPFDKGLRDPGYIKGYPPGLRENGGQYTHGVIWSAIAFAMQGDGDRAGELLALLDPVSHSDSRAGADRWKVEPYVSCADVYTAAGHVGRGGWTWYSGSAGWLYRAIVEWQLGLRVTGGNRLAIAPCLPRAWPGYRATLRYRGSRYAIEVDNAAGTGHGVTRVVVDGRGMDDPRAPVTLAGDGREHSIRVTLG